jgi:hypothetical protein
MRKAKLFGLAAVAAALMAAVGSASASALTVTSCEGLSNCKTTSVNTTFTAQATSIQFANAFLVDQCSSQITGKVTDVSSTSGTDPIDADVTSASFPSCDLAPVHVAGLPWTLTTNSVEFPKGKASGVHLTLTVPFVGTCTYAEDATHRVSFTWTNAAKSTLKLGNGLVLTSGPAGCGSELSVTGTFTISSVADPSYAKANNLLID